MACPRAHPRAARRAPWHVRPSGSPATPSSSLRDLAGRLGLGDRLRLAGFRDDRETVLGAADAVVVASTEPDPLPNAALEVGLGHRVSTESAWG